jgi:hypothetical protein
MPADNSPSDYKESHCTVYRQVHPSARVGNSGIESDEDRATDTEDCDNETRCISRKTLTVADNGREGRWATETG